jgi:hypothetical protein
MKYGSIIKSYDFPGNTDCYMIGKVVNTDDDFIYCTTIKEVFDGQMAMDPDDSFRTPKYAVKTGQVVILD